jgi:O-antigen ligase
MPEHLRALIVILLLAIFTFTFAKKMLESLISPQQFKRWRNAWLIVTLIVFLAGNFWVYALVGALFLWFISKREENKFAFFFVLLFAAPNLSAHIPGFGLLNFLFTIDYVRLLSFTILLPAYLSLRKKSDTLAFGKNWPDKFLLVYLILDVVLLMRGTSFADAMRGGLYNFTDAFLPYYVASRGLKNFKQLKEVIIAFVFASLLAGVIAIFEYSRHWLLYSTLKDALNINWALGNYLSRGGDLRAMASFGQPIVLGYVMVITLGFCLFVAKSIKSRIVRLFGLVLVLAGLFASLSRGPWIGAVILIIVFIAIGPYAIKRLATLAIAVLLVIPFLGQIPGGQTIINMMPFVGSTDQENVSYRVELLDNANIVFRRFPMLGSVDYRDQLASMGMTQGEGIVDVVNSYIGIVLEYGLVGLSLFLGFFWLVLLSIYRSMKKISDKKSEVHLFGRTLLSCLLAILVTIFTVSSIGIIPVIYWAIAGLGVAYARLVRTQGTGDTIPEDAKRPVFPTTRYAITTS